jgi:hypothetical protein
MENLSNASQPAILPMKDYTRNLLKASEGFDRRSRKRG